jgi:hypothetical protein
MILVSTLIGSAYWLFARARYTLSQQCDPDNRGRNSFEISERILESTRYENPDDQNFNLQLFSL